MKTLLLSLFIAGGAMAQTPYVINQNTGKNMGGDNSGMGSSFLTLGAGHLDSIDVVIRSGTNSVCRVYVYEGNTTAPAALLYEQTSGGVPTGFQSDYRIRFTNSVALEAASTYTFMVHDVPLRFDYADGSLWTGQGSMNAGEHTDADLDFIAYIGGPIIAANETAKDGLSQFTYFNRTITVKNFAADEITVHDLKGQQVASGKGESLSLKPELIQGVYVVAVRKGNQVYTARIAVN